jgi:aspartate carbamoyltransferase catalytic subunit
MKQDILDALEEHGVWYAVESDLSKVIREVDVLYLTQIRPGRMQNKRRREYGINGATLSRIKPNAMIMHPLPRTIELDKAVDSDPRAFYFQQAASGLYVRMALLTMVLDET